VAVNLWRREMPNLLWVIVVVLVLLALFGSPAVGMWHHNYGWGPSGGIGLIVLILIVVLLMR
jgi:membrane protein YdbS with pleckstrin-like domain